MIVLSAGMPKAGTGWYFNLTNDLLIAAGHQDVREIRQRFHLYSVLKYHNCNMVKITPLKLALVTTPHLFGNTYVVKTHGWPTSSLRLLMSVGIVKTTYIYRDPRDVAISAFEHGQRIRDKGENHSFAKLDSIETAISIVSSKYLVIWDAWMACSQMMPGQILVMRYEDLITDPINELERLTDFLDLKVRSANWHKILATYQKDQIRAREEALHFNQGIVGRFRTAMNLDELDLCRLYFGNHLQKMKYPE
jgi:hypothetical protein